MGQSVSQGPVSHNPLLVSYPLTCKDFFCFVVLFGTAGTRQCKQGEFILSFTLYTCTVRLRVTLVSIISIIHLRYTSEDGKKNAALGLWKISVNRLVFVLP